jgi:hypothetical protein
MSRVRVTIDRLVLRGLSAADGRIATAALLTELHRRLSEMPREHLTASRSVDALPSRRAAAPGAARGSNPARELGTRAARVIVNGVRQ